MQVKQDRREQRAHHQGQQNQPVDRGQDPTEYTASRPPGAPRDSPPPSLTSFPISASPPATRISDGSLDGDRQARSRYVQPLPLSTTGPPSVSAAKTNAQMIAGRP